MATQLNNIPEIAMALREQLLVLKDSHITALPKAKKTKKIETPTNDVSSSLSRAEKLEALRSAIGNCTRCQLCKGRQNIVFGNGNPNAELVFVGEAPGADEDAQGLPFVGRAGKLLTKMIEAMGISRDDVYICNVIKCRPPDNREPTPKEKAECEPFLKAQLAIIKPRVIVTLGRHATQSLLKEEIPMSEIRGHWFQYEGIPLMPTFHPAYLLRSPGKKKEAWEDLQEVMRFLGLPLASK